VQTRARVHNALRVAAALLTAVAITYQLARLQGHPHFGGPGNFFSFFTIQSNILAAAMFVSVALVRRNERSLAFDAFRTAATFYITITGVVFAALLSGLQEQLGTHNTFANSVVHYAIPAAAALDWLADPPRHRFTAKLALAWLAYPLSWFAYTLVRGSVEHWYPYPFIDVTALGYANALLNCVWVGVLMLGIAAGATVLDPKLQGSGDRRSESYESSR